MKSAIRIAVSVLACVSLTGCGVFKSKKEPKGQVVATIDGDEITLLALKAELPAQGPADAKQRKAMEQIALRNLIQRKVIAKAAQDSGIEKAPAFAIQKERLEEGLLVQAMQSNLAGAIPVPSREEANKFITSHPNTYANRKIYVVDQLRMGRPNNPGVLNELQPLKTLEDVAAVLQANKIEFQRINGKIDTLTVDPRLVDQIANLPPGEMFVVPAGNGLVVNAIRETQVVPFTGEPAIKHATQLLRSQRAQEAISKQFSAILAKAEPTIKYNKAYEPPKAPPGKAPAAKAPAGAAPAAPAAPPAAPTSAPAPKAG